MTKQLSTSSLLLVLATLACAPAGEGPGAQAGQGNGEPRHGGQLNVRAAGDPYDWDMSYAGKETNNQFGIAYAYDSLLGFKRPPEVKYGEMVLRPGLAERWEASPDGKNFTFHLRKGVRFEDRPPVNGRELTAADAKFSYEYWSRTGEFNDKKLPFSQFRYFFEGLETVETPDRYTVMVRFAEPFVPFINYAASDRNPIVPREIFDLDGHLKDRLTGTGPFYLDPDASQKGTRWVWRKNPRYWEADKPYLDQIRWLVVPEEATSYAAFQTKQIDILRNLAYTDFQDIRKSNPQAVEFKAVQPQGYRLFLSLARPGPLRDVRVRRALALAIDRDEVNKVVAGGLGVWAVPGAIADLFTEEEARKLQKQDPEAARRLLIDTGERKEMVLEWILQTNEPRVNLTWYQLVQSQLKKVGINATFHPLDRATQLQRRFVGDFELDTGVGSGALDADPDSVLYGRFHSTSTGNRTAVNDAELDRLLVAQRREPNPEKRLELLRQAARRIVDMVWEVDLVYPPKWDVTHPYVKAYGPHFGDHGEHQFLWLER